MLLTQKDGQKAVSTPVVASPGKSPFTGLEGISLCVRPGELIGIIGVVGRCEGVLCCVHACVFVPVDVSCMHLLCMCCSGKSSLLSALLGHMVKSRGAFGVRGEVFSVIA